MPRLIRARVNPELLLDRPWSRGDREIEIALLYRWWLRNRDLFAAWGLLGFVYDEYFSTSRWGGPVRRYRAWTRYGYMPVYLISFFNQGTVWILRYLCPLTRRIRMRQVPSLYIPRLH